MYNFNCSAISVNSFKVISTTATTIGTSTPLLKAATVSSSKHSLFENSPKEKKTNCGEASSTIEHIFPTPTITPIKALTPYHKIWTIEGRALSKTPIHRFKNGGRDGQAFGFDCIDKESTVIHVTCFNDIVEEFSNVIQLGGLYLISNGRVKVANMKYSSSTNPFEIVLHNSSTITVSTTTESTIPMQSLNIRSIESLQFLPIGLVVDVIGIVLSISSTSTIRKIDGSEKNKCTLSIMDHSNCTIDITLWGDLCQGQGKEISAMPLQPTPPIVLIQSTRIISWRGKALDSISPTSITINPDLLEARTLQTLFNTKSIAIPSKSLSRTTLSNPNFENPIPISSLMNRAIFEEEAACIKAIITKVHLDNFYYLSCPKVFDNKNAKKNSTKPQIVHLNAQNVLLLCPTKNLTTC